MSDFILVLTVAVVISALFLALVRFVRANVPPGAISEWLARVFPAGPHGLGKGWYAVAFALGLLVLLVGLNLGPRGGGEELLNLLALAILGVFLHAWRREFLFLMQLRDDDFPGSFDKLIWAAMLVVLAPIGLWLFRSYRLAHWPEPKPETIGEDMAADLS